MDKQMFFKSCMSSFSSDVPIIEEVKVNNKGYVFFGSDNNVPEQLFNLYNDCTILQTVINGTADYIAGAGLVDEKQDIIINRQDEKLSDLISKIALDYVLFGSFAIQVIKNKLNKVAELNYIDVRNIRLSEDATRVYYNKGWGKYARDIKEYERFTKETTNPNTILYVKNPKSRGVYGLPIWNGAIRDIATLIEASKQNYSNLKNGFSPNVLISFNNGIPSEEIQQDIEDAIIDKYTSAEGNKILLSFADSADTAPTITSFSTEDYTPRYQLVIDSCRESILSAFRASSQLFGIAPDRTAFNSIEYKEAFTLFNSTVIAPIQREIEKAFNKLGFDFTIKPFNIDFNNENKEEVVE